MSLSCCRSDGTDPALRERASGRRDASIDCLLLLTRVIYSFLFLSCSLPLSYSRRLLCDPTDFGAPLPFIHILSILLLSLLSSSSLILVRPPSLQPLICVCLCSGRLSQRCCWTRPPPSSHTSTPNISTHSAASSPRTPRTYPKILRLRRARTAVQSTVRSPARTPCVLIKFGNPGSTYVKTSMSAPFQVS